MVIGLSWQNMLPCGVLQSCADVTFWSELSNRKLDEYKLSETPIDIHGELHAEDTGLHVS
jgi:hypothetical protein